MHVHSDDRRIFPALLNPFERELLNRLSTESGLSRSGVIRNLILKEMAQRQLSHEKPGLLERARSDK